MSKKKISIAGLDRAAVLAALYNAAKPQSRGFSYDLTPMTREDALLIIHTDVPGQGTTGSDNLKFVWIKSRVMNIDITGDEFDPSLFNQDNGKGTAERVINELRGK